MPIPNPKKAEPQKKFMSRCMSNGTMKKEYPDNKQRVAICFGSWRKKHGGKSPTEKETILQIAQYVICTIKEILRG